MPFNLLSEPIRKYIRDKRWEELRPIQVAAIERISSSDDNFILVSRTASGKTEAAFLPILSKVDFNEKGVQVVYISPLIALINDQFQRIEELCKYLDVTITKWHGEANKTLKEKIVTDPQGIVLITPESIEAMFIHKPYNVKRLFSNIKYVVIDEIHSFIGTDRGVQLKSILSRLQTLNEVPYRIVGLSATIGDYDEAKRFTGNESHTKVLLDRTAKEIEVDFRYFQSETEQLPLDLLKDLYLETKDNKVLVFPNSRGRAEEIAVSLKKIAERVKGHQNYFSHHSSVNKEVREYVEYFAKHNVRQNFTIACTSTLELGIDIGSVDEVVQVDATHSIASLIQRVGRSGRREGAKSNLFIYCTGQWSLLQSLACWLLYKEGFIEPPPLTDKPYDILLHQALSIVKGTNGIAVSELERQLKTNFAFRQIDQDDISEIIEHLQTLGLLEKIQDELIIGVDGEHVVNSREFYSVFISEENFKVVSAGNAIGEIPFSPLIIEGENILLSARIWKIKYVDDKAKKIEVVPAKDGKKPLFYGGSASIHPRIREKMAEIVFSSTNYEVLNENCSFVLSDLRSDFLSFKTSADSLDRPLVIHEMGLELFSFTGTRINNTLSLLLTMAGIKNSVNEKDCACVIHIETTKENFMESWGLLLNQLPEVDKHIATLLETNPAILGFSKWGQYLPIEFQIDLLKQKYFDFSNTENYISTISISTGFVVND